MARSVFGGSFVPELREILTSVSTVSFHGRDGIQTGTRDQPFTHPWQLQWIGFDHDLGRSRVICKLASEATVVTAIMDAADFGKLSRNDSKSAAWNDSGYHDMAVLASTLIQEQILTWEPSRLDGEIHIRLPAGRRQAGGRS